MEIQASSTPLDFTYGKVVKFALVNVVVSVVMYVVILRFVIDTPILGELINLYWSAIDAVLTPLADLFGFTYYIVSVLQIVLPVAILFSVIHYFCFNKQPIKFYLIVILLSLVIGIIVKFLVFYTLVSFMVGSFI